MANKNFLTAFLGFAVLLQLSFAIPASEDDSKSTEALSNKEEIEKFAALELSKVVSIAVPNEIEVLKRILNDLKTDDKLTEEDNAVIKEIEEFLSLVGEENENEPQSKTALRRLFKINSIIDPYDEPDKPSKKNPKVHDLLEKHGWKAVRDNFDAAIEPVIDELAAKVKSYYDKQNDARKEKEKKLGNWLEKYDDKENDIDDKINLLLGLVTVSNDSDETK